MTTRKPREGEQEGKDYFFVSKQQFENAIKNNELLEHAIYVNQYYGTPLGYVKQQLQQGKNVFLEIETKGALQIFEFAKKHPEINLLSIFIAPPSLECLRQRLINRKTESIEAIEQRLKVVQEELTKQKYFHHVVINDDYKKASQKLKEIITSSISKN